VGVLKDRVRSAPFANQNLIGRADKSIATKTWAALAEQVAGRGHDETQYLAFVTVADRLLRSENLGDQRTGHALGAVLSQIAQSSPDGAGPDELDRRWRLEQAIQHLPRALSADKSLAPEELLAVFEDIEAGRWDEPTRSSPVQLALQ
jgi:hypothetical protein